MNWQLQAYDIYSYFLFIAMVIVFCRYEKRDHFILRATISFCVGLAVIYFFYRLVRFDNFFAMSLLDFIFCALVYALMMFICFKVSPFVILCSCTIALALEQFSGGLRELIYTIILGGDYKTNYEALTFFLQTISVYPFTYLIFTYFYYKFKIDWNDEKLQNPFVTAISLIIIFFCFIINRFAKWNYEEVPWYWNVGRSLYAMVCSIMSILLFFGAHMIAKEKNEISILEDHMKTDAQKYQEWKEFYEMASVSVHDMKHLLKDMKEKNIYAEKLMQRISFYDHHVMTGNETMDTLIYEKGNVCLAHDINFTHMVDGSALNSIEELDVYCLFSNLIDNSINAVMPLDKVKRNISLVVSKAGDVTMVHISNYYDKNQKKSISFEHGFGLKSISMIVNKYSGTMKTTTSEELYETDITLLRKE